MKKCWILIKNGDEYSNYWQEPIAVFTDKKLAKVRGQVLNSLLKSCREKVEKNVKKKDGIFIEIKKR